MTRQLTFANAVHEGMHQAMAADDNVIAYGLGINDPKSIFGTTAGLELNNLASGSYVNGIWVGDQLLCTEHTFKNIEERLDAFKKERQDRRMAVVPRGVIRYIRRVA